MASSLRAHASQSKPYWQEELASRAATQGPLNSMPPADSRLPPVEASDGANAGAGQAGGTQPKPQTVSQQLPQPMSSGELEAKLRSALPPKHSQGLPPMPQQASSADGSQSEQMQRSLAPRTMLVTPLAPAARRVSAPGQPSRPRSTPPQGDPGQAGASGQLSRPGSAAHLSDPVQPISLEQPTSLEQPSRPSSATEMLQLPPPSGMARLPSLHSMQPNDQRSSMQPASFGMGQHLQQGPETSAQSLLWLQSGHADSTPSLSAQQSTVTPYIAQHQDGLQDRPLQQEQAEQSTHSQHMRFAAEMQQQQQHLGVSSHDATPASYASHSVALGIPAAHMHNTGMTGDSAYSVLPNLAMHSSWMPNPAAYNTNHMPQQLPMHEQHEAFRQQEQCHMGQSMPVPLSHHSGMPGPMQAVQLPAGSLAQLHPANSVEVQQHQHEVASMAPRRGRAPPGFPQALQDEHRPLQDMLAQLQLPKQHEQQQGWPLEDQPMQQSLSQPHNEPMPWLPNAPPDQVFHVPVPESSLPAPERMRHIRPQPQKGDLASCHQHASSSCTLLLMHTSFTLLCLAAPRNSQTPHKR